MTPFQIIFNRIVSNPFCLAYTSFWLFCLFFEYNGKDGPIENILVNLHNYINDNLDKKTFLLIVAKLLLKIFDFLHKNEKLFISYGSLLIPVILDVDITSIVVTVVTFILLTTTTSGEEVKLTVSSLVSMYSLFTEAYTKTLVIILAAIIYYVYM